MKELLTQHGSYIMSTYAKKLLSAKFQGPAHQILIIDQGFKYQSIPIYILYIARHLHISHDCIGFGGIIHSTLYNIDPVFFLCFHYYQHVMSNIINSNTINYWTIPTLIPLF